MDDDDDDGANLLAAFAGWIGVGQVKENFNLFGTLLGIQIGEQLARLIPIERSGMVGVGLLEFSHEPIAVVFGLLVLSYGVHQSF